MLFLCPFSPPSHGLFLGNACLKSVLHKYLWSDSYCDVSENIKVLTQRRLRTEVTMYKKDLKSRLFSYRFLKYDQSVDQKLFHESKWVSRPHFGTLDLLQLRLVSGECFSLCELCFCSFSSRIRLYYFYLHKNRSGRRKQRTSPSFWHDRSHDRLWWADHVTFHLHITHHTVSRPYLKALSTNWQSFMVKEPTLFN